MARSVVCDTGPIIHLAEADALDLLKLFDGLFVPQVVYDELAAGGVPAGFDALDAQIREVEPLDRSSLDPGEASALSLCAEMDAVLLTDDMEARAVAETEGIEVHGSIGIVLYAYGEGSSAVRVPRRRSETSNARVRSISRDHSSRTHCG